MGVIALLGLFNPALSATLRRVVPGGTMFVPPYLSCTLCLSCDSHKLLGNHFMQSPGLGCRFGVGGWWVFLRMWLVEVGGGGGGCVLAGG